MTDVGYTVVLRVRDDGFETEWAYSLPVSPEISNATDAVDRALEAAADEQVVGLDRVEYWTEGAP